MATLLGVAISFLSSSVGSGAAAQLTTQPASPEFSRFFPVWTQKYLEVNDLGNRLDQISWLLQVTETRFDPKGRPSSRPVPHIPSMAEQFEVLLRNSLGISSREFLNDLLGRHFALGWGGPVFRDQFGLICRVKNYGIIGRLLTASKAQPISFPGEETVGPVRVKTYRLAFPKIFAAVVGTDTLILATSGSPGRASMFHAMVELAAGQSENSVQKNPQFQSACRAVRPEFQFLFVLLTGEIRDPLQRGLAGTIYDELQRNITFLSVAGFPDARGLGMEFCIQPRNFDPAFLPDRPLTIDPVMRSMGEGMDLLYALETNPGPWYRRIVELSDKGLIEARQYRAMIDLFLPEPQLREKFLESLGPEFMFLVSSENVPSTRPAPTTQIAKKPRGVLVIRTKDREQALKAVDQIFTMAGGFLAIQNLASGTSGGPKGGIVRENYKGSELHFLDLGEIFPPSRAGTFSGWHVELTWAVVDHFLVLSDSPRLARKMIDRALAAGPQAREGNGAFGPASSRFEPVYWTLSFNPSVTADHVKAVEPIVDRLWLAMNLPRRGDTSNVTKRSPVKLGIGTREIELPDPKQKAVQIAAVLPGYPAWGRLQVGDRVLAVNGSPIDPAAPQKDLHAKVNGVLAGKDRLLRLNVLRAGMPREIEILLIKRNFAVAPQSVRLLYKLLSAAGQKFQQINLTCNYTPAGQIRLNFHFTSKPAPTTQP